METKEIENTKVVWIITTSILSFLKPVHLLTSSIILSRKQGPIVIGNLMGDQLLLHNFPVSTFVDCSYAVKSHMKCSIL